VPHHQHLRLGLRRQASRAPSSGRRFAPSQYGRGQQWRTNPHHGGYGKNKGKNKVYKHTDAPPVPTPYNPWTGAIQIWPMPPPAGHGILGPRPGPRANAFMASSHTGHAFSYGTATYGAPPGVGHSTPMALLTAPPTAPLMVLPMPAPSPTPRPHPRRSLGTPLRLLSTSTT
jgi:hypothetical protein